MLVILQSSLCSGMKITESSTCYFCVSQLTMIFDFHKLETLGLSMIKNIPKKEWHLCFVTHIFIKLL